MFEFVSPIYVDRRNYQRKYLRGRVKIGGIFGRIKFRRGFVEKSLVLWSKSVTNGVWLNNIESYLLSAQNGFRFLCGHSKGHN